MTVQCARGGAVVEILVEDEGPGIPTDRLEIIFDRFYSDRPATDTSRGKNSGLGLSISREIVLSHGGEIIAENRYAEGAPDGRCPSGARFTVRLPIAVPATQRGGADQWATRLKRIMARPSPRRQRGADRGPSGAGKSDLALRCLACRDRAANPGPGHARGRRPRADLSCAAAACAQGAGDASPASWRCAGWASSTCPTCASAELVLVVELVASGGRGAAARPAAPARSFWASACRCCGLPVRSLAPPSSCCWPWREWLKCRPKPLET